MVLFNVMPVTLVPRLEPLLTFHGEDRTPFARGKHERNLRVLVDLAGVGATPERDYLVELGAHELIDMTTSDDVGLSVMQVRPGPPSDDDQILVDTRHPDGTGFLSGVWPASTWLTFAEREAAALHRNPESLVAHYLFAGAADGRFDVLATTTGQLQEIARR